MRQENFDYLNKQVQNAGFGNALETALKANMEKQEPTFQLQHAQQFGADSLESTLHFRKSATSDTYYFNTFDTVLKVPEEKKPDVKQTFFVGKDNNYSIDEAYNLLSNRFVHKENLVNRTGEGYSAWVKLELNDADANGNHNLKPYGESYGFDLDKALDKYPQIKDLTIEADRAKLVDSLKKGNLAEITLVIDGKEQKGFVEANAYARSVSVTDEKGLRVKIPGKNQAEEQGNKNAEQNNVTEKNNVADDSKKNRRQGQRV